MKTFGEQLREARMGKALTQETLARRTGLGLKTISRMESRQHDPSLSTLLKLTRETGARFELVTGGKVVSIHTSGKATK